MKKTIATISLFMTVIMSRAQIINVDMNTFGIPFKWDVAIKTQTDLTAKKTMESGTTKFYSIKVKNGFDVKLTEGSKTIADVYNGNIEERLTDAKDNYKKMAAEGHEVTFLDETKSSFIMCDKDKATNKSAYLFQGYVINPTSKIEYEFESLSYPIQTLDGCKILSNAFKTITFNGESKIKTQNVTSEAVNEPVILKLFTNKLTKEIAEGDTLNIKTLEEDELVSRLYECKTVNQFNTIKISFYLFDQNTNPSGKVNYENLIKSNTAFLVKEYTKNTSGKFITSAYLEDVISGVKTTYTATLGKELHKYLAPFFAKMTFTGYTVVTGLKDGDKNEKILSNGPMFLLKKIKK